MKFAVEKITDDLLAEIQELIQLHWEEIAANKDKIKLNPDYDAYKSLSEAGILVFISARDNGKLVGYYIAIVANHLHYKDTVFANNDILFLHPDYRGGTAAYRMFKYAEEVLKEMGCHVVIISMKVKKSFSRLCEKLGMSPHEEAYIKYIGD